MRAPRDHVEHADIGAQLAGLAGERRRVVLRPQQSFRTEKVLATDNSSSPGRGTRVLGAYVGQALQRPAPPANGTLTLFFAPQALRSAVRWDTCYPPVEIYVDVAFDVDCAFDISLFGAMW